MEYEIQQKLGRKLVDKHLQDLEDGENVSSKGAKHKAKADSKVQQLKKKYDGLKSQEQLKKFSNSSFLTPEAASYLNEIMKKGQSQVDNEIVYAGLHSTFTKQNKFKRTEKYTARYKKRTKNR